MIIIILGILIILAIVIYIAYEKANVHMLKESFCPAPNVNDTHALLAPNIPDDWRCKFIIGGKYCRPNKYLLAAKAGKYEFPKPDLLYDGIFKSNEHIKGNIETQNWKLIGKHYPVQEQYAGDKFLHVAKPGLGPDQQLVDNDIYFPDWSILRMKDKNMAFLDVCNDSKHPKHINGIRYLTSGVGC